MLSIFPSMSIWTPRAWPGFGSHSEYGNDEPIISSVSHSFISVHDGFVPSRPIAPVTNGRSSGTAAFPSSAFATPAPSVSAVSITSSVACRDDGRASKPGRGVDRSMLARRLLDRRLFRQVVGNDQTGDVALCERD